MDWHAPNNELFQAGINCRDALGSDSALANILLLSRKYDTQIAIQDNVLFRYYNGKSKNRNGYGFPLSSKSIDLRWCLKILSIDADQRNVPLKFCLCDERQMSAINALACTTWQTTDGDNDYIYKRERLSSLSGRKLQKKRNRVHHFKNTFSDWHYKEISGGDEQAALDIAAQWLFERNSPEEAELLEFEAIKIALSNLEKMRLFGGILYVGAIPVAMTLASAISATCVDVHYEKTYGIYSQEGAFAVINQCFAESPQSSQFEYINREEDMGIDGLRRAKESYDPVFKLRKYYGDVTSFL